MNREPVWKVCEDEAAETAAAEGNDEEEEERADTSVNENEERSTSACKKAEESLKFELGRTESNAEGKEAELAEIALSSISLLFKSHRRKFPRFGPLRNSEQAKK